MHLEWAVGGFLCRAWYTHRSTHVHMHGLEGARGDRHVQFRAEVISETTSQRTAELANLTAVLALMSRGRGGATYHASPARRLCQCHASLPLLASSLLHSRHHSDPGGPHDPLPGPGTSVLNCPLRLLSLFQAAPRCSWFVMSSTRFS